MKTLKFKRASTVLIVVNTILLFFAAGMPKIYTSEHHFAGYISLHYSQVYVPIKDIVVKDKEDRDIKLTSDMRIGVYDIYSDLDNLEMDCFSALTQIDGLYVELDITREEIHDNTRFTDITKQYKNEQNELINKSKEEGHKAFIEYMHKQHLWFLHPDMYIMNYATGLIVSVFVLLIMLLIYRKQHYLFLTIATSLLIVFNMYTIVHFYVDPVFCH